MCEHCPSVGTCIVCGAVIQESGGGIAAPAEPDWSEKIGKPAAASIVEMVAALELDYDRLEELRDERGAYDPSDHEEDIEPQTWAEKFPDEAEELKELEDAANPCGNECKDQDDARQMIQEDALSVQVRSGWVTPGDEMIAEDFELLLSTGGPAVRIVGELDANGEPHRAWLEVQDWGKPWTQYFDIEGDTLLAYANCFTYGI